MLSSFLTETSPLKKLLFSVFIIIASFFIVLFVGSLIALPIFDLSFNEFEKLISSTSKDSIPLLKYLQILSTIGLFLLPAFVISYVYHTDNLEFLCLKKRPPLQMVLVVIALAFLVIPFINFTGFLNSHLDLPSPLDWLDKAMRESELTAEKLTKEFLNVHTTSGLVFNIFLIAILPALGEELMFRGIVQRIFTDWTKNHHWGIFIASFTFSFIHLQFYGFVPRFLLGILFGYMLVWSKNMWLPIIAHFCNNAIAVVIYFLVINQNNSKSVNIENIGAEKNQWVLSFVSLLLSSFLLYFLYRKRINQSKIPPAQKINTSSQ